MDIVVTYPTLEEYKGRLKAMAVRYERGSWIELSQNLMTREDWFEYSYIVSTVGDQLIRLEIDDIFLAPSHMGDSYGNPTEPGLVPGSVVLAGVKIDCARLPSTY